MSYKKWVIENADREKASAVSEKLNIDPFISYLLAARGIDTELSATEFLSDSIRLISPFSLNRMQRLEVVPASNAITNFAIQFIPPLELCK